MKILKIEVEEDKLVLSGSKNGEIFAREQELGKSDEYIRINVSKHVKVIAFSFIDGMLQEILNYQSRAWIKKHIIFNNEKFQEKFIEGIDWAVIHYQTTEKTNTNKIRRKLKLRWKNNHLKNENSMKD